MFFDGLILFAKNQWERRQNFFENYEIIYPKLVHLLNWRFDCVFFQLEKKEKNRKVDNNKLENLSDNIFDAIQDTLVRKLCYKDFAV